MNRIKQMVSVCAAVAIFSPFAAVLLAAAGSVRADDRISYNRDIRPLFSETCFKCHGPDSNRRKGQLRLDVPESATGKAKSGKIALIPGDLDNSELLRRITSSDPDTVMPPPAEQKALSPADIATLKRWVKEGAQYQGHWAFEKIQSPVVPKLSADGFAIRSAIDAFVLEKLTKQGLHPSPPEEKARLIRRVSLDLTGLPPTIEEVDAFLNDNSNDAYDKVVDRLLASPHFGERMALPWLDLARHSDTGGYHNDSFRTTWLWRDWVVKSFNDNKPFNQFTVEQLAGDLLPNATVENKVASGFMRNVMTSDEGGIIPDEYLNLYIVDRVNTLGTTWLGMTVNCAQCHDHKYDPVTQKDFYSLYAFFHNVPERGIDGVRDRNPEPRMVVATPQQEEQFKKIDTETKEAEAKLQEIAKSMEARQSEWEKQLIADADAPEPTDAVVLIPLTANGNGTDKAGQAINGSAKDGAKFARHDGRQAFVADGKGWIDYGSKLDQEKDQPFTVSAWVRVDPAGGSPFGKMDGSSNTRGWDVEFHGTRPSFHLINHWPDNAIHVQADKDLPANVWTHLAVTYDGSGKADGVKMYVGGSLGQVHAEIDALEGTIKTEAPFSIGRRGGVQAPFHGGVADFRFFPRTLAGAELARLADSAIMQIVRIPADKRTPKQKEQLRKAYSDSGSPEYIAADRKLKDLKRSRGEIEKAMPNTMVMVEMDKPRDTYIKVRGQYDKNGDKVTCNTPHFLPPLQEHPVNGTRHTRLDLANWLVSPDHPLTARVAVNRWWSVVFGTGLVKTVNDFGSQGEWPSHPELLDWLAADFMKDWDIKRAVRQMVTSETYRQTSRVSPELLERDSANRLLARGPRNRLDAEFVRDNALAVSGLLNADIGGKPVFPIQPPGIWEVNDMGNGNWKQQHDSGQYRRGIYIYHRRSTPYPTLLTFDAPSREVCTAIRARSSTPLQSLVLMNDPVYVEAARSLAQRTIKEASDNSARIEHIWRLALARPISPAERAILEKSLAHELERYQKDKPAAEALTKVGDLPRPPGVDVSELAAWTAVSSVVLNLNETITN